MVLQSNTVSDPARDFTINIIVDANDVAKSPHSVHRGLLGEWYMKQYI